MMAALACASTVMRAPGYTLRRTSAPRAAEMTWNVMTTGGFGVGVGVGVACARAEATGDCNALTRHAQHSNAAPRDIAHRPAFDKADRGSRGSTAALRFTTSKSAPRLLLAKLLGKIVYQNRYIRGRACGAICSMRASARHVKEERNAALYCWSTAVSFTGAILRGGSCRIVSAGGERVVASNIVNA